MKLSFMRCASTLEQTLFSFQRIGQSMDELWIQKQCAQLGIERTPLSKVSRLTSSQKVSGIVCTIDKVVAEGVGDVVVRVRDAMCTLSCCIHSAAILQYPMLTERETILILKDITVMCTSRSNIGVSTTVLLCSLENVAAIFACSKGQPSGDLRAATESITQRVEDPSSGLDGPRFCYDADALIFGDNIA